MDMDERTTKGLPVCTEVVGMLAMLALRLSVIHRLPQVLVT